MNGFYLLELLEKMETERVPLVKFTTSLTLVDVIHSDLKPSWRTLLVRSSPSAYCLLMAKTVILTKISLKSVFVSSNDSPLLPAAGVPIELVYEGLVAVVVLTFRCPLTISPAVFDTSLALVRTIFQERAGGFRIVGEVPKGSINVGVQLIVERLLAIPHCWSVGRKNTVNRGLLKAIRLLVLQHRTCSSFLRAVLHLAETEGVVATRNRLRTQRWLLQRHPHLLACLDRDKIQMLCTSLLKRDPVDTKTIELATECIRLMGLSRSKPSTLDAQLATVKRFLQDHGTDNQDTQLHIPLFELYPLAQQHRESLVHAIQRYFRLHERPNSLYHQDFTPVSLEGHSGGEYRKGNVVFNGLYEERALPTLSFHEELNLKTKPFQFQVLVDTESKVPTIVASFARFQGTLEMRRSREVLPTGGKANQIPIDHPAKPIIPQIAKGNSSSKDRQVVSVGEDTSNPTRTVSNESEAPSITPSNSTAIAERLVSTAASVVPVENASKDVPVVPQMTLQPKTAPSGKSRAGASQDGGCVIQ